MIMETLKNIKDLIEKISMDIQKVHRGNHSASIRSRQNAQTIKELIPVLRKEILEEIKKTSEVKKSKRKGN